jgi:hypothetical protein
VSSNNGALECGAGRHEARLPFKTTRARRQLSSTMAVVFAAMLGTTACQEFHLSTSNLEIGPTPAIPGDTVVASFRLRLLPIQSHTIIVFIDGEEHLRVTNNQAHVNPVVVELGAATDLIAQYGTGDHAVFIEVHANEANESTRTQSAAFALNEGTTQ